MNPPKIIGFAFELVDGRIKERPCHGTFQGDIPDQRFRFNISFVEHRTSFKMHSHEYSELTIVLGGRAQHVTDYESYPLEEGDVFVINGNIRHGFRDPLNLKLCDIMYDPRHFFAGNRDLAKMMGFHALFDLEPRSAQPHPFKKRLHLSADELVYVTSLLSLLKTEFDGKSDGRQTIIKSIFLLLATYLSRLYAQQKHDTGTPLVRMAKVISFIQKHYRDPLRIEDLARLAHWSPSQFQRNFRRAYQTTPIHFINQVRIHEACDLLKDPNKDITSIAFDTGFSSSSFFSTLFKRYMGETPSDYRRRKLADLEKQNLKSNLGTADQTAEAAIPESEARGAQGPARVGLSPFELSRIQPLVPGEPQDIQPPNPEEIHPAFARGYTLRGSGGSRVR